MPILCYEIAGQTTPNLLSTTGAMDGQVAAVLKVDHVEASAQVYSELVANRLALFLGIPVLVGVPARSSADATVLHFAALRAAEAGLNVYDFTAHDQRDPGMVRKKSPPDSYSANGHEAEIDQLCRAYPKETAEIAVFDLWIGNADREFNFKAQLNKQERGVIFALDQGSSLLACSESITASMQRLGDARFPSFHPFQKRVNARYCGQMIERIVTIPDWAILAAATYDDTVGNVVLPEQYAAYERLIERKDFLADLVDRVLL